MGDDYRHYPRQPHKGRLVERRLVAQRPGIPGRFLFDDGADQLWPKLVRLGRALREGNEFLCRARVCDSDTGARTQVWNRLDDGFMRPQRRQRRSGPDFSRPFSSRKRTGGGSSISTP